MKTTAERIKEGMDIRNLKQADLVEMTGISKGALSSYISGHYVPKQKNIYLISKALNVNESWLMGNDVPMERRHDIDHTHQPLSVKENSLITEFRKLNPRGQNRLLETAREMNCNPLYNSNYQIELNAAHERTDIEVTEEMQKHDDAIMDDDSGWE